MNELDDTYINISEPTENELYSLDEISNYDYSEDVTDLNNDYNLRPKLRNYQFD